MIRIDALALLLLIECAVVFMALSVFFFFRSRKHKLLYQRALQEGKAASQPVAHPPQPEKTAEEKAADAAKYAEAQNEKEQLATRVRELERTLQETTKQFDALKKKHELLENEYSILYGKHFEGK